MKERIQAANLALQCWEEPENLIEIIRDMALDNETLIKFINENNK